MGTVFETIRHIFEALLAFLVLGLQSIIDASVVFCIRPTFGFLYIYYVLIDQNWANGFLFNMEIMLFEKNYWVGRAIALVGVAVLLISIMQLFWSKHKGAEIVQSGLYSRIRHPQVTGMVIMTLGLAVMVLTLSYFPIIDAFQHASWWLLQALCYIAIAKYEDQKLAKKFGENYRQYQQKVPFLFPRKNPKRIPETLYTVLIAVMIWLLLLVFLPFYPLLRIT